MEIWYTARNTYDSTYEVEGSWQTYIEWSGLVHLKELVSLDSMLNEGIITPDYNVKENYEYIICDDFYITEFYNSLEFVLKNTNGIRKFNLLATIKEPSFEKEKGLEKDWDFIGYELLETNYATSALTNCGGFDETFLPSDLNEFGLISDFNKAKKIQVDLLKNNPDEEHAECYLFEVWRHKKIGR